VSAGILLVHGYSGSPDSLVPLAARLEPVFGKRNTTLLCLPGHGAGQVPAFLRQTFIESLIAAAAEIRNQGKKLILVGHSTGGALALAAQNVGATAPDLLILASVPKKIDTSYLARWNRHRAGMREIDFPSIANLVSLVNTAGSLRFDTPFPVVIMQGAQDELVPAETAAAWEQGSFAGPVRTVIVPGGDHDLFRGPNAALAADVVTRSIQDFLRPSSSPERQVIEKIGAGEPEAFSFLKHSPFSMGHLAACPSGLAVADLPAGLSPHAATEPVFANIEITTRCNLRCAYCARTIRGTEAGDMAVDTFKSVLGMLPHAYRITLVGLGETLMHPNVVDIVAHAASIGRRVALVTNAMLLDEGLSRELLKAGLESIVFSLDGATQEIASRVRPGSDLDRVTGNIRRFVGLSRAIRPISTAVFSAVSTETVSDLPRLVELVSGLGVHVLMLSDLNFRENLNRTVWKNATGEAAAQVRTAVTTAFGKNLPVLSVRGLEEFGLWKRYDKFLLLPPAQLFQRSLQRTWCCSPWQTVPVNVRGEVTICDCQPDLEAGNLLEKPLSEIWNNGVFVPFRQRMLSADPPEACRICPRF
jgi:MoaA/NifB/PqqE/SkfB family radical SAM enzyme/pimeloyl-ACP methyl ester carboxylesterase